MPDPLETKKLKNGGEAPASAVLATILSLEDMWTTGLANKLAIIDFSRYCREGKAVTGRSLKILENCGFINEDGITHDITKDVMLSASEGEGFTFELVSPFAEEQPSS